MRSGRFETTISTVNGQAQVIVYYLPAEYISLDAIPYDFLSTYFFKSYNNNSSTLWLTRSPINDSLR